MSLDELIARLEAADVGTMDLDLAIATTILGWTERGLAHGTVWITPDGMTKTWREIPHTTRSLDAAMALVPPRSLWSVCDMEEGPFAQIVKPKQSGGYEGGLTMGRAANPALALCIAALRARVQP